VILADGYTVVHKGIRDFPGLEGDTAVVAKATDGGQARAPVAEHQPDAAAIDVHMPG
jgi:DNA-binding NarL/FixJ family response regulator